MENKIKVTDLPITSVFYNCNELIEFAFNELISYPLEAIAFRGEILKVTKSDLWLEEVGSIKGRTLVSISCSNKGFFELHVAKSPICFRDQHPCILIPDYVKKELIATLKGDY